MTSISRRYGKFYIASLISLLITGPQALAFELGVSTHMRYYPKPNEFYLDLMKKDGFNSVRFDYDWSHVEEKKVFSLLAIMLNVMMIL